MVNRAVSEFKPPPRRNSYRGAPRRVGIEFEFAGISLPEVSSAVAEAFEGTPHEVDNYVHRVESPFGPFLVEIDTSFLKKKKYESSLKTLGIEIPEKTRNLLEKSLRGLFSTIVPYEVSTPPLPLEELYRADKLRERLKQRGAKGTHASIFYAFGLHLNVESASLGTPYILSVLQSFLLLYPWLKEAVNVDFSRRISPYVHGFSDEFANLVLHPDYRPDTATFLADYLSHNATRNRALDLLPLLSEIDPVFVSSHAAEPDLLKPRPAFHYRMPNCLIDERTWTIAKEWNLWVAIEELAEDAPRLERLRTQYVAAARHSFKPFYDEWAKVIHEHRP